MVSKIATRFINMPVTYKLINVSEISQQFSIIFNVIDSITTADYNPTTRKVVFLR